MDKKMRALDLFCGGGGASMGLKQAGFNEIRGIDINVQTEYPFGFKRMDVFDLPLNYFKQFDFIWASPPCQAYTWATFCWKKINKIKYPDLMKSTRELLLKIDKPYVIENVIGAPLRKDLILDGRMFGLKVIRKRVFELHKFWCLAPCIATKSGKVKDGDFVTVAGHGGNFPGCNKNNLKDMKGKSTIEIWQMAMGIDWITDKKMLCEAVPPAYAKYIGEQFLKQNENNG